MIYEAFLELENINADIFLIARIWFKGKCFLSLDYIYTTMNISCAARRCGAMVESLLGCLSPEKDYSSTKCQQPSRRADEPVEVRTTFVFWRETIVEDGWAGRA